MEKFNFDLHKCRSATELFDLNRQSSLDTEDDTAEIMLALMRQEDERGEKPALKLKQQVRHFTRSSRDLFNAKYNAIKRKMGNHVSSKFQDNLSMCSYGSYGTNMDAANVGKSESSSTRSSIYDRAHRRLSLKSKYKSSGKLKTKGRIEPSRIGKGSRAPIVRCISDNSAFQKDESQPKSLSNAAMPEFEDNYRSSPDIFLSETSHNTLNVPLMYDIPKTIEKFNDEIDSSSTTLSLTYSDSTTSANDEISIGSFSSSISKGETLAMKQAKAQKLAQLLKIIDEEESGNDWWIQPGQTSIDESLPDLTKKTPSYASVLLNDLKAFSQHIQASVNKKKQLKRANPTAYFILFLQSLMKSKKSTKDFENKSKTQRPNNLMLSPLSAENRKLYYSSQPEICCEQSALNVSGYLTTPSPSIKHSRSLVDFKSTSSFKYDARHAATTDDFPSGLSASYVKSHNAPPILQICPSTPTPTPSESDNSHIVPRETPLPCIIIEEPTANSSEPASLVNGETPDVGHNSGSNSYVDSKVNIVPKSPSFHDNAQKHILPFTKSSQSLSRSPSSKSFHGFQNRSDYSDHLNINSDISQCNIDNKSLLVPSSFINATTTDTATVDITTPSPSSPHFAATTVTPYRYRTHHRSLNEINSSNGTTGHSDSPSMKRFTSPASAAVVACASNIVVAAAAAATVAVSTTSTNETAPTLLGSRSKLSSSPSKGSANADISSSSTATTTVIQKDAGEICRRSSDSDLSVTPKGNSICVASERLVAATALMRLTQPISCKSSTGATTESIDSMLEYPFLTMTKFPVGFVLHLGATVAARSVKLLERVPNPDEPEIRDSWWTELRMEIRSHARALGCNVVLGYTESTTISDDVCVLSATGTAAVINMAYNRSISQQDIYATMTAKACIPGGMSTSLEERDITKDTRNGFAGNETKDLTGSITNSYGKKYAQLPPLNVTKASSNCTICHVPYNLTSVPFNIKMKKCSNCRKGRVPDVLLATLEVPELVQITGRGCFMQAQVVRAKKDLRSELNAKEISDGLPFLEYELHRVLINKLKAKGMNAIFGLRTQVSIGERMIALIATGTATFLSALPVPQVPRIVAGNSWTDKQKLNEIQKKLQETYERNQEIYQLKCIDPDMPAQTCTAGEVGKPQQSDDTDESDDEVMEIDLNCGNKDTCVLEVDDIEDLEIISLLMEAYPPEGFHVVNTQAVPGLVDIEAIRNLQMFTQIWRAKLDVGQQTVHGFPKHFQRILQTIYFKLRTMVPCAICDLRFRLDFPESDQIQLLVTGMVLGLADGSKYRDQQRRKQHQINNVSSTRNSLKLTVSNSAVVSNNPEVNGTKSIPIGTGSAGSKQRQLQEEDYIFPLDEDQMIETPTPTSNLPPYGRSSFHMRKTSPSRATLKNPLLRNRYFPIRNGFGVDITPLPSIPGGHIDKYLGNLNFFFIRECTSIRENGGISGFVHSFVTELLAVVRAHIAALGGNAMVSFYMNELILFDNQHKNQGQCLISIGGDAIYVSYCSDE